MISGFVFEPKRNVVTTTTATSSQPTIHLTPLQYGRSALGSAPSARSSPQRGGSGLAPLPGKWYPDGWGMIEPPIPDDEARRLELLRACNIIYTPAEEAFDDVARLAADLCGTEIALITLVDSDYQWFKARVGVEQEGTARDLSFCGHCINHRHPLVVEDTHLDARFSDNPLVTGDPYIRFYAGVPLLVEAGSSIGALSVADRTPRTLTVRQLGSLERLARQVARELGLRRNLGRDPAASPFPIGPGATVAGRWHVIRELGRGASGAVFEARDGAGTRVALKVLLPEWRSHAEVVERFVREARVLMRLRSPHVAQLLDVGNLDAAQGALPYLAL